MCINNNNNNNSSEKNKKRKILMDECLLIEPTMMKRIFASDNLNKLIIITITISLKNFN